jgi:cell division protein FtsZ
MENQNSELIKFELPKDQSSIIKVIGVGGGGSNAVNHMYNMGIKGVDFIICNTDNQSLELSPVPNKIQLGKSLTEGRGAGAKPEIGLKSALESIEEVRELLATNTKMVFITAGMGGGTGTGAAPVIAKLAKEMGILTVGICTVPFGFEGRRRREQAENGINELKKHVDTLLIISNDKLREIYSNMSLTNAFGKADDVLTTAAKGISEIITVTGYINVDFEDVKTVMTNGGAAIMGSAHAEGENRALKAIEGALNSPLLNDSDIRGAKHILLYMTYGDEEITMDEVGEITDYIGDITGQNEHVIFGTGKDSSLGNRIGVTLIATGFKSIADDNFQINLEQNTNVVLDVANKNMDEIVEAINNEKFNTVTENAENDFFVSPEAVNFGGEKDNNDIEFKIDTFTTNEVVPNYTEEPIERISLFEDQKEEEASDSFDLFNDMDLVKENPQSLDNANEEKGVLFKQNDRIKRLQEISRKLKTPSGLKEMENKPAYERYGVKLEENDHSKETMASNLSLSEDKEEGYKLRENNSFLHDSVD